MNSFLLHLGLALNMVLNSGLNRGVCGKIKTDSQIENCIFLWFQGFTSSLCITMWFRYKNHQKLIFKKNWLWLINLLKKLTRSITWINVDFAFVFSQHGFWSWPSVLRPPGHNRKFFPDYSSGYSRFQSRYSIENSSTEVVGQHCKWVFRFFQLTVKGFMKFLALLLGSVFKFNSSKFNQILLTWK